jgi:cytochrome c oxidase subunit 1
MTWVRTLATVGHFHGTVALGTTIAFMGLVYFVIRTMFMREFRFGRLASLQPYLYAATMTAATLMLMYIGLLYGVPRRIHSVVRDIPGTDFSLSAAEPLMMIFGVFALLAIISGAAFVVVALASVLFGEKKVPGSDLVPDGGVDFESDEPVHKFDMRGTFVITLIFLGAFIVVYIANWYLLSQLWSIGP